MKIQNIEKWLTTIFLLLVIPVLAALFIFCMRESFQNFVGESEFVKRCFDNIFLNAVSAAGIFVAAGFFGRWVEKHLDEKRMDRLALIVSAVCSLAGAFWVLFSKSRPLGDQSQVVNFARAFNNGDWSGLGAGQYVGRYVQQLGIITPLRVLNRLFGSNDIVAFQLISALMLSLLVYSGYGIVKILSKKDRRMMGLYLAAMLGCAPMYGYTPFVYAEIPSTALMIFVFWRVLLFLNRFSWAELAIISVSTGVMLQLRGSMLIGLVACGIVILVKVISENKKNLCLILAAMALGGVVFESAVMAIYAPHIPEDSHGMPTWVWLGMGTHDLYEKHGIDYRPGWYDGWNEEVFLESGCDPEVASQRGKEEVAAFVEKCLQQPSFALDFFTRKVNTQWNAPGYQWLYATEQFDSLPSGIVWSVYYGTWRKLIEAYMNIYQIVIYGGTLAFAVCSLLRRKTGQIERMLLLIGVYGDFLFTLFWEAKARYPFTFFILMIPCAAMGIYELWDAVSAWNKSRKTCKKPV